MIVEELTLKNWRNYREKHTFRFNEKFNLIVGRNEAGKSTVFEALTRSLFDRHNSKSEEIKKIQPLDSSLGPEVELIFRHDGQKFKLFKRFLQNPTCEIFSYRNEKWERDHEGDKADSQLHTLLTGDESAVDAKNSLRGMIQALWYLQCDEPLPKKAWSEGVKQGLSGLVQLVVRSPVEEKIVELIEKEYSNYFTPTGKFSSSSELANLQKEIPQLEEELRKLDEKAEEINKMRLDLECFNSSKIEKEILISTTVKDLEVYKQKLASADEINSSIQPKKDALKEINERLNKYKKDFETINRRLKEIDKHITTRQKVDDESNLFASEASQARISADRYHNVWKSELELSLQSVETELTLLQKTERVDQLKKDRVAIQDLLSQIKIIESELNTKREESDIIRAPSKHEWEEFLTDFTNLKIVEGKKETTAIRIAFEFSQKNHTIIAQPDAQISQDGEEYLVTGPTIFSIQNVGKVYVRGGGPSLEELDIQAKTLKNKCDEFLTRFGAEDHKNLSDIYQRKHDLDNDIKNLQKNLKDLKKKTKNEDPEKEIIQIENEIIDLINNVPEIPDNLLQLTRNQIRIKLDDSQKKKEGFIKSIHNEQLKESSAHDRHLEYLEKAQTSSSMVVSINSQIKSLEKENGLVINQYGTIEELEQLLKVVQGEQYSATQELFSLVEKYEKMVEKPRLLYEESQRGIKNLDSQLKTLDQEIFAKKALIERATSEDLYSSSADLEAMLITKRKRLMSLLCTAEATKLLRDMVTSLRKEESAALIDPVSEQVNKWLTILTDDTYSQIALNDELLPHSIKNNKYHKPLPIECLSYGTHEQIVVLLRLAIGVILSKNERNLIVIDDRLVNADSIRIRRFCSILNETAANHCQLIMATCNETPYASIDGNVIRVPEDGIIQEINS